MLLSVCITPSFATNLAQNNTNPEISNYIQTDHTPNIKATELPSKLKKGDWMSLCVNGEHVKVEILELKNKTILIHNNRFGSCEMPYEDFNKLYMDNQISDDDNITNGTVSRALISVWVYGPFWSTWRWAYGDYWAYYTPDGEKHIFIHFHPCWHMVYGWFKLNYWHIEQIWWSGTLPWNYVKYYTPRPTYDNLHYQGERRR